MQLNFNLNKNMLIKYSVIQVFMRKKQFIKYLFILLFKHLQNFVVFVNCF